MLIIKLCQQSQYFTRNDILWSQVIVKDLQHERLYGLMFQMNSNIVDSIQNVSKGLTCMLFFCNCDKSSVSVVIFSILLKEFPKACICG